MASGCTGMPEVITVIENIKEKDEYNSQAANKWGINNRRMRRMITIFLFLLYSVYF